MKLRPHLVASIVALSGCAASAANTAQPSAEVTVVDLGPLPSPGPSASTAEPAGDDDAPTPVAAGLRDEDGNDVLQALTDDDLAAAGIGTLTLTPAPGGSSGAIVGGILGGAGGLGGLGGSGLGSSALGGAAPAGVTLGPAVVSGAFPADLVQLVAARRLADLERCRRRGARGTSSLPPSVEVRFRIEPNGTTSSVAAAGSTVTDPDLIACVLTSFRALRFPPIASQPAGVRMAVLFKPMPPSLPRPPAAPVQPPPGP